MNWFTRQLRRLPESTRSILLTFIHSGAAGLSAVAFQLGIGVIYTGTFVALSHESRTVFVLGTLAVITACSLAGGWLLTQFCREAAGSGIPQLKFAFWQDFGFVPWKAVWVKFVAGLLHVGGGLSLGREGPSVHIAGGIASQVAGVLGLPKQRRRRPAASGAAAGLAAAFNTPLAAITFVLEELVQDMNSPLTGSIILASVLGAFIVHAIIGKNPAFILPQIEENSWKVYFLVPLASAAAALAGLAFQKATMRLRRFSKERVPGPAWLRPLFGGLTVWALGVAVFLWSGHLGVFSLGYDDLSAALRAQLGWQLVCVLLVSKWIVTVSCYGWGGCGGIFSPSLFLGAMAGAAVAGACAFAGITRDDCALLAIVGMSSCLCAVMRAPFTSILIVFEMTHQFALVPTLLVGALVSEAIARALSKHNFYDEVLAQDGIVLVHVIPPRDLRSWQAYPVSAIANFRLVMVENLAPAELQDVLDRAQFERFPVVAAGRLAGCLTRSEIAAAVAEKREPKIAPIPTCSRAQTIGEVARLLIDSPVGAVVLMAEKRPAGIVTLHDLLRAQETLAVRGRA